MATHSQSPSISPPPSTLDDEPHRKFIDDPDADVILRSCDSQEFRVLKLFIIKNSPVLSQRMQGIPNPPQPGSIPAGTTISLPVVRLSDNGAILSTLLTFIFPMSTVLPPTLEETMELLSVAQKYEMASVLSHIRGCIALKHPPLISSENAFHAYSLAQKYGLRHEAVQAARFTLTSALKIEKLEGNFDAMPGAHLYELWKYHESVKGNLKSSIQEFIGSCANHTFVDLRCPSLSRQGIPRWLDDYLSFIVTAPSSFNLTEFQKNLARHITGQSSSWFLPLKPCAACLNIPNKDINTLWTALTDFVNGNIAEADLTLSILGSEWESNAPDHTRPPAAVQPLPEYLYSCKADIVIQSSDLINFPVHKSILAFSSEFFRTMFSLPQPPTDIANELPVLHMSEDAEIVRALLTVIYPIPSEIPVVYDQVLSLLAASQKYDMPAVQSFIRTEIRLRVPAARAAGEAFRAYAIASKNGLSPETSTTAYLTLDYPLTFESLGSELCSFEGWALRDLVRYHKSRRDDVSSCLESFLDVPIGPSKIWVGCPDRPISSSQARASEPSLPSWLQQLFIERIFTLQNRWVGASSPSGIIEPSSIRTRYLAVLRAHAAGNETQKGCEFCLRVHACQGEEYCSELERRLAHARNKEFVPEVDSQ